MKKTVLFILFLGGFAAARAQKVDSIYFNLYTDSLKKGTHNYINVDGKCSNGTWMPMTAKDIIFTCSAARFEGNSLVLDKDFAPEKVVIRATLKSNPAIYRETTIFIKKKEVNERLKTSEEVMQEMNRPKTRRG